MKSFNDYIAFCHFCGSAAYTAAGLGANGTSVIIEMPCDCASHGYTRIDVLPITWMLMNYSEVEA